MSHSLVAHSPDLTRLAEEGFNFEIRECGLVVRDVPYVTSDRRVSRGTLVSELTTTAITTDGGPAERTGTPSTHEIWFVGETLPYDNQGREITIINQRRSHDFGGGLVACCSLSGKRHGQPPADYYDKITNYVDVLTDYAGALDRSAKAQVFPVHEATVEESVFRYLDSASSRSGTSAITSKLKLGKVAIVGLGGTGSYILDLIAKTPIQQIHLFDDDVMFAHNGFRMPGAASLGDIAERPYKVAYLLAKYDPLRRNIFPHEIKINGGNVDQLQDMDFVFLSMDAGPDKEDVIRGLEEFDLPFVDCGMGVKRRETSLGGIVRTTASLPGYREHTRPLISFVNEDDNEYAWNIQTADLNMLNAAFAVIKWKKIFGFYDDRKRELDSSYTVARNQLLSSDLIE